MTPAAEIGPAQARAAAGWRDGGRPGPWDQPYSARLDAWERAPGPVVLALMAAAVLVALPAALAIAAADALGAALPRRGADRGGR